jgi:hypothetical protein
MLFVVHVWPLDVALVTSRPSILSITPQTTHVMPHLVLCLVLDDSGICITKVASKNPTVVIMPAEWLSAHARLLPSQNIYGGSAPNAPQAGQRAAGFQPTNQPTNC